MKPLQHYLRTGAVVAGLLGATALPAVAASPASATPTAYGSGAAVQKAVQAQWLSGWTPPTGDSITYTGTTNGNGLAEFGNETGSLDVTQDATANPVLDGYVGVDNPVTPSQVASADSAAAGSAAEVTIPVGQVSEAIVLHVPTTSGTSIALNSSQTISLTNKLAEQLFAGTVPAAGTYLTNTWGAFLEDAGLTVTTGTPSVGQFKDNGAGTTKIVLQLRADGAGATQVLKQYLRAVGGALSSSDWSSITPDEKTQGASDWPTAGKALAAPTYASSDSVETGNVAAAAGSGYVGYGTIAAALTSGFGAAAGSTNLIYASLQDNGVGVGASPAPRYASPYNATTGASNVYTGSSVNTSGTYAPGTQTGAGNWIIPTKLGVFQPTGQWATNPENSTNPSQYSHPWDYEVYQDTGSTADYYPLSIGIWDLSWSSASWNTGNLKGTNYPVPTGTNSVEETVSSYFTYVTGSTGQAATTTPHFAPLPTGGSGVADIKADAVKAAAAL